MKGPDGRFEFRLRCDEPLARGLADAAKRSVRSVNGEMIYRLKLSLGLVEREQTESNQ
jgi:hypothetical protein